MRKIFKEFLPMKLVTISPRLHIKLLTRLKEQTQISKIATEVRPRRSSRSPKSRIRGKESNQRKTG
jgi:hypothetical protein